MLREYVINNGVHEFLVRDDEKRMTWMLVTPDTNFNLGGYQYNEDNKEDILAMMCDGWSVMPKFEYDERLK